MDGRPDTGRKRITNLVKQTDRDAAVNVAMVYFS